VVFQSLPGMQTRHLGQFWAEQKAQFPITSDVNPLLDVSDIGSQRLVVLNVPPLRRMMCFSQDQQFVMQVQDSRFYLNWRKQLQDIEYPRYPSVHDRFQQLWTEFQQFIQREQLGTISVQRYELVYVNHIPLGPNVAQSLEEYVKLFRFSPINATYLSPPESVNTTWKFAMPNQYGTATATLSNAIDEKGQNILVLVLTCLGTPSEKYSPKEWYQVGHEWIVRSFTELTTDTAHQKWERER
jgi:uncharacterized protein (TIGR04255 family)